MHQLYSSLLILALTLLCSGYRASSQVAPDATHLKIYQQGQETLIPIAEIDSIRFEQISDPLDRPIMGIDYVAEYNVGKEPGTFATSHANDASGYYPIADIGSVCPSGYHTPSRYEAAVLVPSFGPNYEVYLFFQDDKVYNNVAEAIQVGETKASYLCDYKASEDSKISYALRFKQGDTEMHPDFPIASDNSLLAAYRYEIVGVHTMGSVDAHLQITVRYLGNDFTVSIDDIASEEYWAQDNDRDVTRIIPSSVYFHPQSQQEIMGMGAYLWTSSSFEQSEGSSWTISYIPQMAYISYNSNLFKFGIRPFKNSL